jgi:hypothetical protein
MRRLVRTSATPNGIAGGGVRAVRVTELAKLAGRELAARFEAACQWLAFETPIPPPDQGPISTAVRREASLCHSPETIQKPAAPIVRSTLN